jgi:hypothetical protein
LGLAGARKTGMAEKSKGGEILVRELADVLAGMVSDEGTAKLILDRADFPTAFRPPFNDPLVFWSAVTTRAAHGQAKLDMLLVEAREVFPHNPRLREIQARLAVSSSMPTEKVDADVFASLLDRHSPWSRFRERCRFNDHLVMWAVGDPRQNISLFYDRIRNELSSSVAHRCYTVGAEPGDGTVAEEWARALIRVVPGSHRRTTLFEALRDAASDRPAMFLLNNQRGALDDDLGPQYIAELIEFVARRFIPAAMELDQDSHAVRLFMGIQTAKRQRKSKLAQALRVAMLMAMTTHRQRLGLWEEEAIELPNENDVRVSLEELVPGLPLDEGERKALARIYKEFRTTKGGTLQQLATRIYPLYERLHDARTRSEDDG